MAERRVDPLVGWALATFHVTLLVALFVTLFHLGGDLGAVLADLQTATGVALFVVLWATTWWTGRQGLTRAPLSATARWRGAVGAILHGVLWGAIDGLLFFVGLVAIVLVPVAGLDGAALILAIGSPFAVVIGGVVGGAFATLDVVLFRSSRHLLPAELGDRL